MQVSVLLIPFGFLQWGWSYGVFKDCCSLESNNLKKATGISDERFRTGYCLNVEQISSIRCSTATLRIFFHQGHWDNFPPPQPFPLAQHFLSSRNQCNPACIFHGKMKLQQRKWLAGRQNLPTTGDPFAVRIQERGRRSLTVQMCFRYILDLEIWQGFSFPFTEQDLTYIASTVWNWGK